MGFVFGGPGGKLMRGVGDEGRDTALLGWASVISHTLGSPLMGLFLLVLTEGTQDHQNQGLSSSESGDMSIRLWLLVL